MTEASPSRGKNGQFIRSLDTATKDTLAARLRATGMSYREIAAKLEYADESGAHRAVSRALAAVPVEAVNELRALECARMDEITARLWDMLNTRYPLLAPGVELVGSDGKPVADPAPILAVVDRLLRISERRAKLLGLDAPVRVAPPTLSQLDAWIAELIEQNPEFAELPGDVQPRAIESRPAGQGGSQVPVFDGASSDYTR